MNCEQFEILQTLKQVQEDINKLINSIQEIALAQAAAISLRHSLTTDDVFTAISQANILIERCTKGESINIRDKQKKDKTTQKQCKNNETGKPNGFGDPLYNLAANIAVYSHGIEITRQRIESKYNTWNDVTKSLESNRLLEEDEYDEADDMFLEDNEDSDEWTPQKSKKGKRDVTNKKGQTSKRRIVPPAGHSKRRKREQVASARRSSPRKLSQGDIVVKQEIEGDDDDDVEAEDWNEEDENEETGGLGEFSVEMVKEEQIDMQGNSADQELTETLDTLSAKGESAARTSKTRSASDHQFEYIYKGLSFSERMKHIVTYKKTGKYPEHGLPPNKKNVFRKNARRFKLLDNGDLMCSVKGKFKKVVPDEEEQKKAIQECHEAIGNDYKHQGSAGRHLGRDKTLSNLSAKYYWIGMSKDISEYIQNCDGCQNFQETGQSMKTCTECGRQTRTTHEMRVHMMIHSNERPFCCDQCPATFRQRGNLTKHNLTHTGERPHKCNICGRGFYTREHVKRHKLVHTGEKPFLCGMCGMKFGQLETLNRHQIRIHATSPRQHVCNICGKDFVEKPTLTRHMRMHTGEKPFVCPHCGRPYSINYKLKLHIKSNEVDPPQICGTCSKEFKWKCAYDKHECRSQGEKAEKVNVVTSRTFDRQYEAALGMGESSASTQVSQTVVVEQVEQQQPYLGPSGASLAAQTQSFAPLVVHPTTVSVIDTQNGGSVPVLVPSETTLQTETQYPPYPMPQNNI